MTKYPIHPLAELFPLLPEDELQAMADDIKENGLNTPITIHEGMVLDGQNRQAACEIAGVEPDAVDYDGTDPIKFIDTVNLNRRHLTESQRGLIAYKIAELLGLNEKTRQKANKVPSENSLQICKEFENQPKATTKSIESAAKRMKVAPRTVQSAKIVFRDAPEKVHAIVNGEKTIHKALKEIKEEKAAAKNGLRPYQQEAVDRALDQLMDETGHPVPMDCMANWLRGQEVRDILTDIRKIQLKLTAYDKAEDILFAPVNWQSVHIEIKRLKSDVGNAVPYAICPTCSGRKVVKCQLCQGLGFLSKYHWDIAVPSEIKAMREKMKVKK